ncbi:hypothetical protein [Pseudoalteromonas piscicida]|uniref:hypothetical protein n=1 Tax=Pseudoalteromonas piscicida TaxID=43662 RepID=UPI0030A090E9
MHNPLLCRNLTYTAGALEETQLIQLKRVIEASFADVDVEHYFTLYFESGEKVTRRLRLFLSDEKVVGYCLLTFDDSRSDFCLVGASAAFLPSFRGKNSTFLFSLTEVLKRYLRYPWRKLLYADTMLSPAMFRAMAKNIAQVYPSDAHQHNQLVQLYELINPSGRVSIYNGLRCLKVVGRRTNYSQEEVESFRNSRKNEIAHYCRVNPDFDKGVALVVVIPITLQQFFLTFKKRFFR